MFDLNDATGSLILIAPVILDVCVAYEAPSGLAILTPFVSFVSLPPINEVAFATPLTSSF